ncbi:MAG: GNAT family N-acetyltransferase [Zhengella sp.]|uniref:GNAT family N-acetyltransferase n=1 Tax=Zhengella sp. TaxID=2282762 RepID=UPI001E06005C|nr:GNAT family N-acetyltransferase [Notoacmeibacter sp.]MCC0025907.1 GNAT family N-acetyltransferase [Brucellaceae bacterium]
MSASDRKVHVRLARDGDAQAVLELQDALFPDDPNRLSPGQLARPGGDRRILVLVAELEDRVAGFLVLRDRSARLWTSVDFVGTAAWAAGKGVGGALVRAACRFAPRPVLRLFVRPSNAPARALYARQGFRHTATRKRNYADGEDAMVMMKWLGPRFLRRKGK